MQATVYGFAVMLYISTQTTSKTINNFGVVYRAKASSYSQPNAKWYRFESGWLRLTEIVIDHYLETFKIQYIHIYATKIP